MTSPRTIAELNAKPEILIQLRSDGTVPLREDQLRLEEAIRAIQAKLSGLRQQEVQSWMDGGDDFDFE